MACVREPLSLAVNGAEAMRLVAPRSAAAHGGGRNSGCSGPGLLGL